MARKPILTTETIGEGLATFKEAVTRLGHGVDARIERRHDVFVDGVPLRDRQNEMRRPDSSYYEQTFIEANAVAHAAINLNYDKRGRVDVNRLRTPMPDTELRLDGSTIAFTEQTMVMDQEAHRLSLDVEALNAAARACDDPGVRAAFKAGMLHLRFEAMPPAYYTSGLAIADILAEIVQLARNLKSDTRPLKPEKQDFPLLAGLGAFGQYRLGLTTHACIENLHDHGRPELFENAFLDRLQSKRKKAHGYPASCRPLWLLLDVERHFGWHDYTRIARNLIDTENPAEYDRIIVQQTHFAPLIIDFPREKA
jgi:hypothetical protein